MMMMMRGIDGSMSTCRMRGDDDADDDVGCSWFHEHK